LKKTFTIISIFSLLLFSSCIERYYPDENEIQAGMLVVSAHLHDQPGPQWIHVSRSISLSKTVPDPLLACYIEVECEDGEVRIFDDLGSGQYMADLDASFLKRGKAYRMHIITPEGKPYESEFEILHPSPDLEDVYYEIEERPSWDPADTEQGIRFYADFEIENDSGRYLRWELVETYELHNPDYETRMYGTDRRWYPLGATDKILDCWITADIPVIYTLDIGNISGETYRMLPLNFVSGQTKRLHHGYSLLVRQFSLSEKAFWYWNELAKNVQSGGRLFDKQPALTPSNICSLDEPGEQVIGYFSISGVSEKRIFVEDVPGLDLFWDPFYCAPLSPPPMFLWNYPSENLPLYVASGTILGRYEVGEVRDECIDCRLYKGSTNVKPDFW
jgi:hypothetical protein